LADAREEYVWTNHAQQMATDRSHTCDPISNSIKLKISKKKIDVLDYGCGTAQWAPTFKDFNYFIYDQNEAMIKGAKVRLANLQIQPKDIYLYPWNALQINRQFDVVYTSAIIQHNTHQDKKILLPQIYGLIKSGGLYIGLENTLEPKKNAFQFPRGYQFTDETTDGYSYTRVGWLKYFSSFGFIDESEDCMKFWGGHKSDFYVLRKPE
jgi:SAM-dependent methyltransferase